MPWTQMLKVRCMSLTTKGNPHTLQLDFHAKIACNFWHEWGSYCNPILCLRMRQRLMDGIRRLGQGDALGDSRAANSLNPLTL